MRDVSKTKTFLDMKPLLAFIIALSLVACSSVPRTEVTREEVLLKAKKAISKRETWSEIGHYMSHQDKYDHNWRITVGKIADPQPKHECGCLLFDQNAQSYEIYISKYGKLITVKPLKK